MILQLRLNGNDWAGGRLTSYASSGELSTPGGTLVIQKLYNKRVPDGTHTIEVVVDPLNFVTESEDGNNSMSDSMTGTCNVPVPGGKPDLNLSNLRLEKNCQVAFTIKNIHDGLITGDLYQIYIDMCKEIEIESLTQRRISGLINELDAMGLLNARVVSFGRHGRTKKIKIGVPDKALIEAFSDDNLVGRLISYEPKKTHRRN